MYFGDFYLATLFLENVIGLLGLLCPLYFRCSLVPLWFVTIYGRDYGDYDEDNSSNDCSHEFLSIIWNSLTILVFSEASWQCAVYSFNISVIVFAITVCQLVCSLIYIWVNCLSVLGLCKVAALVWKASRSELSHFECLSYVYENVFFSL